MSESEKSAQQGSESAVEDTAEKYTPDGRLNVFEEGTFEEKFNELYARANELGRISFAFHPVLLKSLKDDEVTSQNASELNRLVLTFCMNVQDFLVEAAAVLNAEVQVSNKEQEAKPNG